MKKALMILLFVLLAPLTLQAQQWYTANSIPIAWDVYPPHQTGDTISYYVYAKNVDTDELLGTIDTPNGKAVAETANLTQTLTFSQEGRYYVGVATKRIPTGTTEVLVSPINWSNENGAATPNPFGVRYFVPPNSPLNLRTP